MVTAPARREVVAWMRGKGLSERSALKIVRMSASALRYRPVPDRNAALRQKIVARAQRHRRYGAGMIYLKLRQAGVVVNHKRVERLYAVQKLQIKRRKRKKVPITDRQPLERPDSANTVWSMDFIFDRISNGRQLKILGIVDDATTECIAAHAEHALGGDHLVRILDRICQRRGYPGIIRTDNGREFTGRDVGMGAQEQCKAAPDRAGQTESERLHRVVQQPLPRRMPERTLVLQSAPCTATDRGVATRVQRGATEERARRADARAARQTTGNNIDYSNCQPLDQSATQKGVTPPLGHIKGQIVKGVPRTRGTTKQ